MNITGPRKRGSSVAGEKRRSRAQSSCGLRTPAAERVANQPKSEVPKKETRFVTGFSLIPAAKRLGWWPSSQLVMYPP